MRRIKYKELGILTILFFLIKGLIWIAFSIGAYISLK